MSTLPSRLNLIFVLLRVAFLLPATFAQEEFPPPQGSGHVVVLISGIAGPRHDRPFARDLAALGYDIVLFDGTKLEGHQGEVLKEEIAQARQKPHGLPGKVALIGLSMGGGFALAYGSRMPDDVAVVIVWYPATGFFLRSPGFMSRITVPVLMFAGESDTFRNCCLISTARSMAADAAAVKAPFELVTLPNTEHDFIVGGENYNPSSYKEALARTADRLKATFAN